MLEKRLMQVCTRYGKKFPKGYEKRERHAVLQSLEGWYDASLLSTKWGKFVRLFQESGSPMKMSRWLVRNEHLTEIEAASLMKEIEPTRFKFSCRHNDLLRLGETEHYKSCLNVAWGSWGHQMLPYLSDPCLAVVFIPDEKGDFKWRALVRLLKTGSEFVLGVHRRYGNGPELAVFAKLSEMIPVYLLRDIKETDPWSLGEEPPKYVTLETPSAYKHMPSVA